MQGVELNRLRSSAQEATRFLKGLANHNRLLILCHLANGEKSVGALELAIGLRQPTLSQQLARLRGGGLVRTRRNSKVVYYSIADGEVRSILKVLYRRFCVPRTARKK